MATATLIAAALPQFCPTTNLYACDDGRHLLVTVATLDSVGTVAEALGLHFPVSVSHLPTAVDVFLADGDGLVLDADGDPANGMTPLGSFEVDTHEAALAELGYELIGGSQ